MAISSFKLAENDLSAQAHATKQYDQNGDVAALIKIETNQTGFAFDGGSLGITHVEQHTGEVWVYVPAGARKITIRHPQLETIRDYVYPIPIEAGRTYILKLTSDEVKTVVVPTIKQQFVVFNVEPTEAIIEFDGTMLETDSTGEASRLVKFGTYKFRISAPNYHTYVGSVIVNDPNNKVLCKVTMKAAFGRLKITSITSEGGSVYVDNLKVGTAPLTLDQIASGKHNVKIVKSGYKAYETAVVVTDGQTTELSPLLVGNTTRVTFTVEGDAEIWINGELRGKGRISDFFEEGSLKIECRKEGHRASITAKRIVGGLPDLTIPLPSPEPIYGTLVVTSTPSGATVIIDGRKVGQTPAVLSKVLVGGHDVTISATGYKTHMETVTVEENQQSTLQVEFVK